MLAFGGNLTAFNFLNYFARNLDNALIGWRWGAWPLGIYSKAYQLMLLPISQITSPLSSVAIPALSRLHDDPVRYRSFYIRSLKMIAYFTMPAVACAAVLADDIVRLVLGSQWAEAAGVFRLLAIAAIFQPILATVGWLYVSGNRTKAMARWGLIASPLLVISFVIGLPWGPRGVSLCYSIMILLLVYPCFYFATSSSPVSTRDVFEAVARPICIATGSALLTYSARLALVSTRPMSGALLTLALTLLAICVAAQAWKQFRGDIGEATEVLLLIFRPSVRVCDQ